MLIEDLGPRPVLRWYSAASVFDLLSPSSREPGAKRGAAVPRHRSPSAPRTARSSCSPIGNSPTSRLAAAPSSDLARTEADGWNLRPTPAPGAPVTAARTGCHVAAIPVVV